MRNVHGERYGGSYARSTSRVTTGLTEVFGCGGSKPMLALTIAYFVCLVPASQYGQHRS